MPGDALLNSSLSVLIVDRSAEAREVLRMALTRQGVRVIEAMQPANGLTLARSHHPNVIVIDLDNCGIGERVAAEFAGIAVDDGATLLALGNDLRARDLSACEFVAKPYHYKPLILKIEESLLQRRSRTAA